jgi:hypothetical protein
MQIDWGSIVAALVTAFFSSIGGWVVKTIFARLKVIDQLTKDLDAAFVKIRTLEGSNREND